MGRSPTLFLALLVLWVVATPPLRACRRLRAEAEREARVRLCGGAVPARQGRLEGVQKI